MGPLLRMLGGAMVVKARSAFNNRLQGEPPAPPGPPRRTQPGGAPTDPETVESQLKDNSLKSVFRDLLAGNKTPPGEPDSSLLRNLFAGSKPRDVDLEQYDAEALQKRLGVPALSEKQIDTEKTAIDDRNATKVEAEKKRFKDSLKKVTGNLLKMGIGVGIAIHAFNRLIGAINKADMEKYRAYSPRMAQAAAIRDLADIRKKAHFASLTDASTARLSEKVIKLRGQQTPYEALAKNVVNGIGGLVTTIESKVLGIMDSVGILDLVNKANAWFDGDEEKDKPSSLLDLLEKLQRAGTILAGSPAANMRPNEGGGGRMF